MLGKIMVNTSLPRHPKLFALAAEVGVSWPTALGHLVALWAEVMAQKEGGVLEGWARGDLERVSGWKGKRGVLAGGLEKTGWIDDLGNGTFSIHDWDENQGNILEDRKYEAKRKRVERAHKKGTHCVDCPDVCRTSAGRPTDVTGTSGVPVPSLPVPSLPIPAGGARTDIRTDTAAPSASPKTPDPEAREVDCTVGAFAFCGMPGTRAKALAIIDLRRQGISHEYIRSIAAKQEQDDFYEIIRRIQKGKANPDFKASTPARPKCKSLQCIDGRVRDLERTTAEKTVFKPCPDCQRVA